MATRTPARRHKAPERRDALETRAIDVARTLLAAPTATFLEGGPAEVIRRFARERPELRLRADAAGNLRVSFGDARAKAPLVFMAHLDHPGFAVTRVRGGVASLEFRGGVRLEHARRGAKLAVFAPGEPRATGKGTLVEAFGGEGPRRTMLARGRARIDSGEAAAGGFTMWDFPGWSMRGGRIVSRCLDDLLGAAAALAALDEIRRSRPRGAAVIALFTRAEEVGFFGAFEAIRLRTVPRRARVISLETSRALPHAPQGGGVIVRVGDARSLFDARFMGVLHEAAKELAARDRAFRFQRRLMDGGSCEATPYCAAGYVAGGLALPLGNYHNMAGLDGGTKEIGPETVAAGDYFAMVKLLVRLGTISGELPALESRTALWTGPSAREARSQLGARPIPGPASRPRP